MPIENPQVEQLKKINTIDNKLDNIDNKFDQKNDEFLKEIEIIKNEINDLSKEYNTFDERLKTSFDGLKKDYNDLFVDATINNQSYYGVDKLESLKYNSDEIFNKNETLFNSIHANWTILPDAPTKEFKNIIKDYAEKGGEIKGEKVYEVDPNFKCQNQIDNGTKVFRIPGEYITDIKTGKKLAESVMDCSFGSL